MNVDSGDVEYRPLESIDPGDRVSVSGEMDDADLFEEREVEASSVILLENNRV